MQKGAEYLRWALRKFCVNDFQAMILIFMALALT